MRNRKKMCSKTTSSESYGDDDYFGLCPKKHKPNNNTNGTRRRVPRRGPGVAELEKIRLEEQQQQQHNDSSASLLPSPPFPPAITTERTGSVYPYIKPGSFPNDLIPPAPVFHRNHDSSLHYLPRMDLPKLEYERFYQFMEPPLNQTYCLDNVSQLLDDEKIVAAKRPWHLIAETTKCSAKPAVTISRDGKKIKSLDHRLKNHFQDSRTTIRNPITIDSSSSATPHASIIPNSSLGFPPFIQKEKLDHQFAPRRSVTNKSSNIKPFYSFLAVNEQKSIHDQDLSFSLKTDRFDTVTDHGIDLRLKL